MSRSSSTTRTPSLSRCCCQSHGRQRSRVYSSSSQWTPLRWGPWNGTRVVGWSNRILHRKLMCKRCPSESRSGLVWWIRRSVSGALWIGLGFVKPGLCESGWYFAFSFLKMQICTLIDANLDSQIPGLIVNKVICDVAEWVLPRLGLVGQCPAKTEDCVEAHVALTWRVRNVLVHHPSFLEVELASFLFCPSENRKKRDLTQAI